MNDLLLKASFGRHYNKIEFAAPENRGECIRTAAQLRFAVLLPRARNGLDSRAKFSAVPWVVTVAGTPHPGIPSRELCPVLCPPPNPTTCHRLSPRGWSVLLDKAFVAVHHNWLHSS
jgi:hypothetical protein